MLGENALGWYLSDLCCPLSKVGCIEVLPCVKSSRLAISVSWLSGGIQEKNDMAQCNMVAIKIPNACRFACKSLLLDMISMRKTWPYHITALTVLVHFTGSSQIWRLWLYG